MSGGDEPVAAAHSRAAADQHFGGGAMRHRRIGLGDGWGDGQTSQLHQLINREAVLVDQFLLYRLPLVTTAQMVMIWDSSGDIKEVKKRKSFGIDSVKNSNR